MSTEVFRTPLTKEACKLLGDGDAVEVAVYAVPGGFVFGYSNTFSGHLPYADENGEVPFKSVEAAVASANDPGDEDGNFVGPGTNTGEYYGSIDY